MSEWLTVVGILLGLVGAALLALIFLYPESARRQRRRARNLAHRAQEAGLKGRWAFQHDRTKPGPVSEYGTYEPNGNEDRALYAVIGSRIEGEAAFFATEMLWTDARLAWVGTGLLILGVAISVGSILS
jgi:hypothetical protein